jgi:hypothetical protein
MFIYKHCVWPGIFLCAIFHSYRICPGRPKNQTKQPEYSLSQQTLSLVPTLKLLFLFLDKHG